MGYTKQYLLLENMENNYESRKLDASIRTEAGVKTKRNGSSLLWVCQGY